MAPKYEWRTCTPFRPKHIPGVEITEIEKSNAIAFGTDISVPRDGPCLSVDYMIEVLKKLKKLGCTKCRIERIENPNGWFVVAFVGTGTWCDDDERHVGIVAPCVRVEDGVY